MIVDVMNVIICCVVYMKVIAKSVMITNVQSLLKVE